MIFEIAAVDTFICRHKLFNDAGKKSHFRAAVIVCTGSNFRSFKVTEYLSITARVK